MAVYWLIHIKGSSAETIALLSVGCVLLVFAAINEMITTRSPIIPPRLFRVSLHRFDRGQTFAYAAVQTRTTGIILITCFLHAVTFFAGKPHLKPRRIPFVKSLSYQAHTTFLFITRSLDRLQPVLVSGEIPGGCGGLFAIT